MFGRTVRLEPATGSKKTAGTFRENQRPREFRPQGQYRDESSSSSGGYREFSTLRAVIPGFMVARRPVQLNQFNALVGRRMFGLAASVVLRKRVV
jgi:hypothetical protein